MHHTGNEPIDGIIGADLLLQYVAIIDYGNERLYLQPSF